MAKYNVVHICGHTSEVQLFGSGDDRKRRIAWMEKKICSDCYKKEQIEQATANAKKGNLPDLEGSEKQIAWAIQIRQKRIEEMVARAKRAGATAEQLVEVENVSVAVANSKIQSKFWIENRSDLNDALAGDWEKITRKN